jgi:hypothetical protein
MEAMARCLDRWGRVTTCRGPEATARTPPLSRPRRTARVREVHELRPDLLAHERPALLWNLVVLAARPLLWVLDRRVDRASRARSRR